MLLGLTGDGVRPAILQFIGYSGESILNEFGVKFGVRLANMQLEHRAGIIFKKVDPAPSIAYGA
jgi:hypothetical protein